MRGGIGRILLAAFLARLLLLVVVPPGYAPDERAHLAYLRHLAAHRTLPVQRAPMGESGVEYEFYQPPLYYLFAFPTLAAFDFLPGDGEVYAVRALSVAMGVGTVAAIAAIARLLAPADAGFVLAVASLAAFLPAFVANGAAVTNDSVACLLGALALLGLGGAVRRGTLVPVEALALAGALGGALLTKTTGLALVPAFLVALAAGGLDRRGRRLALFALLAGLLLAVPWYLRNVRLYGHPLALDMGTRPWADRPSGLAAAIEVAAHANRTFWVALGRYNELELPLLRPLLHLASAAAILGLGLRIARRRLAQVRSPAVLVLAAHAFALAALVAGFGWRYGQGQGRFLFPALGAIAPAWLAGWETWTGRGFASRLRRALPFALAALLGACLLLRAIPSFYPSIAFWRG